VNVENVFGGAF